MYLLLTGVVSVGCILGGVAGIEGGIGVVSDPNTELVDIVLDGCLVEGPGWCSFSAILANSLSIAWEVASLSFRSRFSFLFEAPGVHSL